eukprot:TRINITY_DN3546_c0_g2_i1.p1 TRINITY_DN3546_c0_g2~~TRINITY_DN3546_c0_g2_i1.p1  ORF type:complete len:165 (-),score=30.85 TRINITY_DN3546_c0_g2_i1:192-686(-)
MDLQPIQGTPGTFQERTFIAVKPDGVHRGLLHKIVKRFENKGYKLVGLKLLQPTRDTVEEHYQEHRQKSFFDSLCEYILTGPLIAMVWEGRDVILGGRALIGATDPAKSAPGTIRGDLCVFWGRNIIHGSDGVESAEREIKLWFRDDEIVDWVPAIHPWLYSDE